jgi:flagellar secretion chaperone FliS
MTSMHDDVRSAYTSNSVGTASPAQLLVMLYDRLVLDVERALRAQMKSDADAANTQLLHAQAIITELQVSLDPEGWKGGPELLALYHYLQRRLIQANVRHDQRATKEVLVHCRGLRDTWKRAALIAAGA